MSKSPKYSDMDYHSSRGSGDGRENHMLLQKSDNLCTDNQTPLQKLLPNSSPSDKDLINEQRMRDYALMASMRRKGSFLPINGTKSQSSSSVSTHKPQLSARELLGSGTPSPKSEEIQNSLPERSTLGNESAYMSSNQRFSSMSDSDLASKLPMSSYSTLNNTVNTSIGAMSLPRREEVTPHNHSHPSVNDVSSLSRSREMQSPEVASSIGNGVPPTPYRDTTSVQHRTPDSKMYSPVSPRFEEEKRYKQSPLSEMAPRQLQSPSDTKMYSPVSSSDIVAKGVKQELQLDRPSSTSSPTGNVTVLVICHTVKPVKWLLKQNWNKTFEF